MRPIWQVALFLLFFLSLAVASSLQEAPLLPESPAGSPSASSPKDSADRGDGDFVLDLRERAYAKIKVPCVGCFDDGHEESLIFEIEALASEQPCGYANLTINGQSLPQQATSIQSWGNSSLWASRPDGRPVENIFANWQSDCVRGERRPSHEANLLPGRTHQILTLAVKNAHGKIVSQGKPGFTVSFQQTGEPELVRIEPVVTLRVNESPDLVRAWVSPLKKNRLFDLPSEASVTTLKDVYLDSSSTTSLATSFEREILDFLHCDTDSEIGSSDHALLCRAVKKPLEALVGTAADNMKPSNPDSKVPDTLIDDDPPEADIDDLLEQESRLTRLQQDTMTRLQKLRAKLSRSRKSSSSRSKGLSPQLHEESIMPSQIEKDVSQVVEGGVSFEKDTLAPPPYASISPTPSDEDFTFHDELGDSPAWEKSNLAGFDTASNDELPEYTESYRRRTLFIACLVLLVIIFTLFPVSLLVFLHKYYSRSRRAEREWAREVRRNARAVQTARRKQMVRKWCQAAIIRLKAAADIVRRSPPAGAASASQDEEKLSPNKNMVVEHLEVTLPPSLPQPPPPVAQAHPSNAMMRRELWEFRTAADIVAALIDPHSSRRRPPPAYDDHHPRRRDSLPGYSSDEDVVPPPRYDESTNATCCGRVAGAITRCLHRSSTPPSSVSRGSEDGSPESSVIATSPRWSIDTGPSFLTEERRARGLSLSSVGSDLRRI
ncbi:MAG: hypothetical protein M1817_003293 [Caeruleum heppii]|nr:MAG: hypothetical protein M1817_003293 [Caeruleum heppii]